MNGIKWLKMTNYNQMYKGFEIELIGDSPNEYVATDAKGNHVVFGCNTLSKTKKLIDDVIEFRKKNGSYK